MSAFPTMDRYNAAVQHPERAFRDAQLKKATIAQTGLGLPKALGGGFAITYQAAVGSRKFAVRCFYKESLNIKARYRDISSELDKIGQGYFVGFEYQNEGIEVDGKPYPIVKMEWADGDTLGSFLEDNFSNGTRIETLLEKFREMERFLRSKTIAHGDLQNGNVLVSSDLKLIDYDGMYVPRMARVGGTELGQKNFQHPKRANSDFGPNMDRFSFIVIDVSLRAVVHEPELFNEYSNGENIVFNANDFIDPDNSAAFTAIAKIPELKHDARNLARVCKAPMQHIPSLDDFIGARNIPTSYTKAGSEPKGRDKSKRTYVGAFDVVDGTDFAAVKKQIGNKVEIVGKVLRIYSARTKPHGTPYSFVIFKEAPNGVKLNFWKKALENLKPGKNWRGKWLSVQGLVDPVYSGKRGSSLSITIETNNQIRKIGETEARWRLNKSGPPEPVPVPRSNLEILEGHKRKRSESKFPPNPKPLKQTLPQRKPQETNRDILDEIKRKTGSQQVSISPLSGSPGTAAVPSAKKPATTQLKLKLGVNPPIKGTGQQIGSSKPKQKPIKPSPTRTQKSSGTSKPVQRSKKTKPAQQASITSKPAQSLKTPQANSSEMSATQPIQKPANWQRRDVHISSFRKAVWLAKLILPMFLPVRLWLTLIIFLAILNAVL